MSTAIVFTPIRPFARMLNTTLGDPAESMGTPLAMRYWQRQRVLPC